MKQGIDKTLFDKLHGYRETPPGHVWERIERSLAEGTASGVGGGQAGDSAGASGAAAAGGRPGALAGSGVSGARRHTIWATAAGLAAAVALAVLLVDPAARMQQMAQDIPPVIMPFGAHGASVWEDPATMPVADAGQAAAPVMAAARPASARTMAALTAPPEPAAAEPETYSTPLPDEQAAKPDRTAGQTPQGEPSGQTQGEPSDQTGQTGQQSGQSPQGASQSAYGTGAPGSYSQNVYAAARNSYNPIRRNRAERNRASATLYAANLGGSGSGAGSGSPASPGGYQLMEVVTRAADRPMDTRNTPEITSS
ncbi:MAG: hypothetical protein LBU95_05165, partial [Rikenellaceae bacterium]|nr:hypothetical protein [Rikenellaceae bacterium]